MNAVICQLDIIVSYVLNVYTILLIAYAVVSWIPDLRGRWTAYLGMVIEPLLIPLRRIIPPTGGLDLSFLVLVIAIQILKTVVGQLTIHACYSY
ncbi:MAG: YggT family protein [Candidatus Eremiobacteraeota bacterium]|nr:YggT family protein [Candidatus Eremiobacteraeota bacterium]